MAGRRRPVVWSPEAEADLADIWNYYAEVAGPKPADTIVRAIGDVCRMIEDHPLAGPAREEVRPGLRSALARPHVIFYRIEGGFTQLVRSSTAAATSMRCFR
jgi:toxin ParE1/3/4